MFKSKISNRELIISLVFTFIAPIIYAWILCLIYFILNPNDIMTMPKAKNYRPQDTHNDIELK